MGDEQTAEATSGLTVARDGILAYVFLAFVGSAGIFYISAIPGIVSALVDGLGFSESDAGYVISANAYGSMTGALIAVFLVKRFYWKRAVALLFVAMIGLELASTQITSPDLMMGWRFMAGVAGGCSVGFGLSLLARLSHPDRAFGILLVLQFAMGGLIIYLRLMMEPLLGVAGVFVMLAALIVVSMLWLPFLGRYETDDEEGAAASMGLPPLNRMTIAALVGIFLYQASANGIWTYIERVGQGLGLAASDVSATVAYATWAGVVGGIVPIVIALKYGRSALLFSGIVMTIAGIAILSVSTGMTTYLVANVMINLAWSYALAYLLGLTAHFDLSGQLAAMGGMASKFGLATGPLIAATMLTEGNYTPVMIMSGVGLVACLLVVIAPSRASDRTSQGATS